MRLPSAFRSLKDVVAHLPFPLLDVEYANEAFVRWHQSQRAEDKRVVDLWTYCFVRRYFLLKFGHQPAATVSDQEAVIAKAYWKVARNRDDIKKACCYASWVSVVCKNTYLNYRRSARRYVSIHDKQGPHLVAETSVFDRDTEARSQSLHIAVECLPNFLKETARLRMIQGRSYREISEITGKSVPVTRSYVSKIRKRLRRNPRLRRYLPASGG